MLAIIPKADVTIREATMSDLSFIDGLQKMQSNNLGFLQFAALEGKIAAGQVLVAEIVESEERRVEREMRENEPDSSARSTLNAPRSTRIGYIIAQDRYFKRDDVGIIYQMNVVPGKQRGFVASALLRAQFDRSAYGCRLYCCWCAQDLEANKFWEAMGFVPLAFRAGSEKRGKNGAARVHIFWQKKIRGNEDGCHWWFPHKTEQGAMRADRLVFPIPPGTHWTEVKAVVLPHANPSLPRPRDSKRAARGDQKKAVAKPALLFAPPKEGPEPEVPASVPVVKAPREKKPKVKLDPQFVSAAREFRDRYLEEVNERGFKLESAAKYDLTRAIARGNAPSTPLLAA